MENVYLNPVAIKIHNGTLRSDSNLCLSCRNAFHAQPSNSGREVLVCQAVFNLPMKVSEPIAKCTGYFDRTKPTLSDMTEIAWMVMTNKGGRTIGFRSPSELRERGGADSTGPPARVGF